MTTPLSEHHIEMPSDVARDLADGYVLIVSVDGVAFVLAPAGAVHPDSIRTMIIAAAHDVPVLRLTPWQLLDLVRGRPVRVEHRGRRYLVEVYGVDSGEEFADDKD